MLIHGGDIAGFVEEFGRLPLDFSANVSPFGLPSAVRQAAMDALAVADQYPDPLCRNLGQSIANFEHCSPNQVLCGNGAADLIFRLAWAKRPKQALLLAPTFAEYGIALAQTGCSIQHFLLEKSNNFQISADILDFITPEIDIFFLCQPNNPTSALCSKDLMVQILERCEATGTLLVVDQCFCEFLDNPEEFTLDSHLKSPNLLILKAFTKIYAMAGLRLGYCLSSNGDLLQSMAQAGQPWGVSCVAQQAGIAALKQVDYVNQIKEFLKTERPFLATNLAKIGCTVFPPSANFIFFQSVPDLDARLRKKGILIRSCANYQGLEPGYFRIAVRTHSENLRLLKAVQEVL